MYSPQEADLDGLLLGPLVFPPRVGRLWLGRLKKGRREGAGGGPKRTVSPYL